MEIFEIVVYVCDTIEIHIKTTLSILLTIETSTNILQLYDLLGEGLAHLILAITEKLKTEN